MSSFADSVHAFVVEAEAFFEKEKAKIENFVAEFAPAVEHVVEVAFEDLVAIAGQAVMAEVPFVISGSEKFGNAVTHVVQTVEAAGKQVAVQTAQAAVQLAYKAAQNVAVSK